MKVYYTDSDGKEKYIVVKSWNRALTKEEINSTFMKAQFSNVNHDFSKNSCWYAPASDESCLERAIRTIVKAIKKKK